MGYNNKAAEVRDTAEAVRQKKIEKNRKKCLTNENVSDKINFAAEVRNAKADKQKKIEKIEKKCLTNEITSDKIDFAAEKAERILEN